MFWPWESPSRSVRPLPSQLKTVNTFGRKRTPWTNDLFSTWRRGTSGIFYRITFFFLCWVLCGVCVWSTPQGLVIWGVKRYRDGLPFILQLTTGGPRLYWLLFPLKLIFMSLELVGMVWVRTSKQRSRFVATRPEQFQPVRTNLNLNLLCFSIVWLETWNSKLITFFSLQNPHYLQRWTPLQWAVENGHDEIVKLLISAGANVEDQHVSSRDSTKI